jgi:hypothetical protein
MTRAELLESLREAAGALAEFRHLLPAHSPEAHVHVEEARQHVEFAIILLEAPPWGDGREPTRLAH